ncbi:MAG: hypothetical protein GF308_05135 [Candidatus Heimdallarchaeota archaeon]|nr:hypothetical protein [Candidatus Heimdallarchaeota archaeon]
MNLELQEEDVEDVEENSQKDDQFSKLSLLIIPGILISAFAILSSSIFLFYAPGLTSGIIFGLVIIIFAITPLIIGIFYYQKKLK